MGNKLIQITEYGIITCGENTCGEKWLSKESFDKLENFILENIDKNAETLLTLSVKKGLGKIITAKNNVGIICLDDGTTIEILPKIYSKQAEDLTRVKELFIKMLRTLRGMPYKNIQTANVNVAKMNILEIFIRMFIEEVNTIVKKGLKCDYETISSNENFYKGKMLFNQQIKHNFIHKERCFVEYDTYTSNRVENSILKATLQYLYRSTTSAINKKDIRRLLDCFDGVDESTNYKEDFSKIVKDRNLSDYDNALRWSEVFLQGKSFTSFKGNEVAFALLFPMEKIFESYVAKLIRKQLDQNQYTMSVQDSRFHLFDEPRAFSLRPDIVIKDKNTDSVYVLDTKWKKLNIRATNYGISQEDIYQMYVYQKKYHSDSVTLLYPLTDDILVDKKISYVSQDNVTINVEFIDLFKTK